MAPGRHSLLHPSLLQHPSLPLHPSFLLLLLEPSAEQGALPGASTQKRGKGKGKGKGKGDPSPFTGTAPKQRRPQPPFTSFQQTPPLQLPLSGGPGSGREGQGPVPSWARAEPWPQEPRLVAVLPAIGPAAASEEQCAPTVWYQIVHQNYYFQHLWLNCKTIIQMTLGVCWS